MLALFLGGEQHGVMLTLPENAPYWDFPAMKPAPAWSKVLPDEITKLDRVRYKLAMFSPDRDFAVYAECGDAKNILLHMRDWIVTKNQAANGRQPEPVHFQVRRTP